MAAAEENERARLTAEERARKEREDRAVWEQLAAEAEQAKAALAAQLQSLQADSSPGTCTGHGRDRGESRSRRRGDQYREASTRALIDEQLRARGWEADTQTLPLQRRNTARQGPQMAIAEWPTASGPADYALFIGTRCIAVVEAKRRNKNVSAHIDQAERYARTSASTAAPRPLADPWPDGRGALPVPFVFSANGRPYLKQLETESGIWFRDARKATNHRRALVDWPTPDGLKGSSRSTWTAATADAQDPAFRFRFSAAPLSAAGHREGRGALAHGRREMLLAMATGTGKTKLAIALLYRLLTAKRFRRVCFVVDRNALGTQAAGEFSTTRIVSAKTFADIFGLKGLETVTPEPETKVHICTIQGLVKRVLFAEDPSETPPIDQYDLMVVDECHRGYLLDRELSDAELSFRNQEDYISKYRRVLEHFDAVKIGLTATPALHTVRYSAIRSSPTRIARP